MQKLIQQYYKLNTCIRSEFLMHLMKKSHELLGKKDRGMVLTQEKRESLPVMDFRFRIVENDSVSL